MLSTTMCLVLLVSGLQPSVRPVVRALENPAGARSRLPNFALGADGELYLSWVEPGEGGVTRLRFSRATAAGWTAPRTIASGSDWFVNWADFPSMAALADGTLIAHWLGRLGSGTYAYGVQMSISRDGGKTWGKPFSPHSDRSATEHGFVSIVPASADRFRAVWLDGRAMVGGHDAPDAADEPDAGHGHGAGMSIRTALIDRRGKVTKETLIDDRTCECCQTAAVVSGEEVVVAWRDRTEDEVRDIAIARIGKSSISTPKVLHNDGWNQEGCPVNGPSLAASGSRVGAAWYTEAKGRPQVLFAESTDGGKTFSTPIVIDDGNPVGRVDLVSRGTNGWLACWLERGDETGEVRVRSIEAASRSGSSLLVARTSVERNAGFPRVDVRGDRVLVAWTEAKPSEGGVSSSTRVRTAELVFPSGKKPKPLEEL